MKKKIVVISIAESVKEQPYYERLFITQSDKSEFVFY